MGRHRSSPERTYDKLNLFIHYRNDDGSGKGGWGGANSNHTHWLRSTHRFTAVSAEQHVLGAWNW